MPTSKHTNDESHLNMCIYIRIMLVHKLKCQTNLHWNDEWNLDWLVYLCYHSFTESTSDLFWRNLSHETSSLWEWLKLIWRSSSTISFTRYAKTYVYLCRSSYVLPPLPCTMYSSWMVTDPHGTGAVQTSSWGSNSTVSVCESSRDPFSETSWFFQT